MGCGMTLEYFEDERVITKEVSSDENKFDVEVLSNKEIFEIEFIEGGNQIERVTQLLNFNVKRHGSIIYFKNSFRKFSKSI